MSIEIPQLHKTCQICHHEKNFEIQKAIDNGESMSSLSIKYNISKYVINSHIKNNHRISLIAFGEMDYVLRKKSVDAALILADYIDKWAMGLIDRQSKTIRDNDALKALELFSKIQGTLVNKHEITVKKSIEEALSDFLGSDLEDEIVNDNNEIKKES